MLANDFVVKQVDDQILDVGIRIGESLAFFGLEYNILNVLNLSR
jgi:hypothetical protein